MRKRSNYKPRPILLDTMHHVKSGLSKMTDNPAALDLRIKNHSAMKAIVQGCAVRSDIDIMIAALNITEALAKQNYVLGGDWQNEIRAGQNALLEMTRRGIDRDDRFIFTGMELTAVNLAMEIHDAQIDQCNVAQLEAALILVQKMIRGGSVRRIEEATA